MCRCTLVGGGFGAGLHTGLWSWDLLEVFSRVCDDIGARLLIRDLMCFVPVFSLCYLLVSLLLSAVNGTMYLKLACGIGT